MVKVTIDERAKTVLAQSDHNDFGLLYGLIDNDDIFVLGCAKCNTLTDLSSPNWNLCLQKIHPCLPGGILICGVFLANLDNDQSLTQFCKNSLANLVKSKFMNKPEVLVGICVDNRNKIDTVLTHNSDQLINMSSQAKLMEQLNDKLLRFRMKIDTPIQFNPDNRNSIQVQMRRLRQMVESTRKCYFFPDWKFVLSSDLCKSDKDEKMCNHIFTSRANSADKPSEIDVEILQKSTNISSNSHTPILECEILTSDECKLYETSLSIEILVFCLRDTSIKQLSKLFTDTLLLQLHEIENLLQDNNKNPVGAIPTIFHYYLPGTGCPIMILYPNLQVSGGLIAEETLEDYRRNLHKIFYLPDNKPLLRRANSYQYRSRFTDGHLVNTHEGLSMTKNDSTQIALVNGYYSYYHYMQDNINDDQWGCAYRSFQTLYSWFRHQGYTDKPTPMHKDIQQALCDVGDKPSTFIGSKKWIGSYEVNICLDHFLNVSSKILCVSSGAELPQKARELIHHFKTEGTPIMIGGGVLAHTIIGISFNDITGEVRFLILDPHYTGKDDLKNIQTKGWCGWKGPNFWDQRANYNLCLPIAPSMI